MLLGRQTIEGADVFPADHVGALHFADDLEAFLAGFRLEHLFDGDEVGDVSSHSRRLRFALRSEDSASRLTESSLDSMRFCLKTPLPT